MNSLTPIKPIDPEAIEALLVKGDLSNLSSDQVNGLIIKLCDTMGLNPLTKPFDLMKTKDGREILYANKGCAEQLRMTHSISIKIVDRQKIDDVFVVTAEAIRPDGRVDSSTGAVSLGTLKGELLANAMMKAETKSKRRVTLSICGLNMLDETEVETVPGAEKMKEVTPSPQQSPAKKAIEEIEAAENDPGEYTFQKGGFKGKKLKELSAEQLRNFSEGVKGTWFKADKPIPADVQLILDLIRAHLENMGRAK